MALSDILVRIDSDAAAEAGQLLAEAEGEAVRTIADAEATATREREQTLAATEREARNDAATLLANARLAARDTLLARKRELAEEVLASVRDALEGLPEQDYLDLIVRGVAAAAQGGETLLVSRADAARLNGLGHRLKELGVDVEISHEPAHLPRGVLVTGDRVQAEVSPRSLVDDRRDQLLPVAARALFGGGE